MTVFTKEYLKYSFLVMLCFFLLFGLFWLKSDLATNLASSARVNRMMARALLTSNFVMMDRNFLSSAVEGTFSWTATQIFRRAAWGLQMLSDLRAVSGYDPNIVIITIS